MPTYTDQFSGRSQYDLVLVANQGTQEIANNRSLINSSLRIDESPNNGSWSNTPLTWAINIAGQTRSGSTPYDFRNYDSFVLFSGSFWVGHRADGTQSISVSGSVGGGTTIGSASTGGSFALTTIPRASTTSWAVQGEQKYIGSTYGLVTNRASSGFTHTIAYSFGNSGWVTIATGVGASVNWTIPRSLLTKIPNGASAAGTLRTQTYSGGTLIGTTTSNMTLTAPLDAVPTFDTITHAEATPDIAVLVGAYVQGATTLNLAITGAAGVEGSTISSYQIEVRDAATNVLIQTLNTATGVTDPINASSVKLIGKVTDSRGRTATKTVTVDLLPWQPPALNAVTVQRALSTGVPSEEGTYLRVNLNAAVSSLINGTQKNKLGYRISTRVRGTTAWTLKKTVTDRPITFNSFDTVGTYSPTTAYDVLVEVFDILATSAVQIIVPTAAIFMHWGNSGAGEGLGVGKYWERGAVDVRGPVYQNDKRLFTPVQTLIVQADMTFSKIDYPWLAAVRVRVVGGGGAGGSTATTSASVHSTGSGGGGGGYAESFILASALSADTPVTIGLGGPETSPGATNDHASSGGTSSFGSLVVATGGQGGAAYQNNVNYVIGDVGIGGVGTAGDLLLRGSSGGQGGGYGNFGAGGAGGDSQLGVGGAGVYNPGGSTSTPGKPGSGFGGGGGGAAANASSTARFGGAGAPGVVIIELYA